MRKAHDKVSWLVLRVRIKYIIAILIGDKPSVSDRLPLVSMDYNVMVSCVNIIILVRLFTGATRLQKLSALVDRKYYVAKHRSVLRCRGCVMR